MPLGNFRGQITGRPSKSPLLRIKRPPGSTQYRKYYSNGAITRDQLGRSIGRLSFSKTSLFGRRGRPVMSPLHIKLNTHFYHPLLTEREVRVLQWRVAARQNLRARKVMGQSGRPDYVVFVDAAAKTNIITAVTSSPQQFIMAGTACEIISATTGGYWGRLF